MNTKTTPILVILLIVAAFLIGMFSTKVQYLESGKGDSKVAQASPSSVAPQPQAEKTLGAQEAAQLAGSSPAKGSSQAKVTIVEFSDFQCPYCGKVQETLKKIFETYPNKVKLVFRNYPLPFHENAEPAAQASLCANEQGKFWEFHDKLFANQEKLTVTDLKQYAANLGVDANKFNSCLDSGKYKETVQKDIKDGGAVGVSGTPAIFINGRAVTGAQPFENFKKIIDEELAK
ncbi:MAG: DsbA family protein [Patescibacteria group bacterium]|nr:DsbA family protein [Patescibacteria group bacterium]MCL5095698.1 DsbA family protein [Patescibacteria group bacterium]